MKQKLPIFPRFTKAVFVALFFCAQNSFSQALTPDQQQRGLQQNIQNEQRLERERQEIIKQREIKDFQNSKRFDEEKLQIEEQNKFYDNGGCLLPKEVGFEGNSVFSEKVLRKKFLKSFEGKCLTKSDIAQIQKDLNNFYIKKGYSNARVYFDKNELIKNKILIFFIAEGFVEEIKLQENSKIDSLKYLSFRNDTKLFTAFPFLKKKPFNLRDFEQGIDQMNRLQSNSARIDSEAGKADGSSEIIIKNQISKPTNFTLGYDNMGQQSTGKYRRKGSISQDNLLALNDNIYINYSEDDVPNHWQKMNDSLYSSISIPFGYYTFGASYSKSKYLTTIDDNAVSFTSSGQTTSYDYNVERMLLRGQNYKLSFKTGINLKETASFIRDVKSDTGSRKLTLFSNSLTYKLNHKTKSGEVSGTYANLAYIKGMDWFDAKSDDTNIAKTSPHAQFDKVYLTVSHSIPFATIFIYKASLDAQYSFDTLFGSERFSLGGPYSVRGFDENNLSADNGYSVKNDLEMRLPTKNPYINKTLVSVFYDYGFGRSKYVINQSEKGYMSGTGVRIRYPDGKYFDWDLTYARGLHVPNAVLESQKREKDKETIYFNINMKFGV